jgi:hypothetical protein
LKKEEAYIKHIYWLTGEEENRLRGELVAKNFLLKVAMGAACMPLDPRNKVSSVAPEVWNQVCKRQGSWYRSSIRNGMYLIVSAFALRGYKDKKAATITESAFIPPRLATWEEKQALCQDRVFRSILPEEWQRPGDMEKRIFLRWASRFGSSVQDYDLLYLTQTANHANFFEPRFFIRSGRDIVPYSIDRTAHLCSCCVEMFQVLGGEYRRKLVAPCPGACIFARLKPDRYLLVRGT